MPRKFQRRLSATALPLRLGRRRFQLDVDSLDQRRIPIRQSAYQVAQELPLLARVLGRADLAGEDALGVGPVHVPWGPDVHDAIAVLLEGEGAQVLRAYRLLENAEELRAGPFDDRHADH